MPIETNTILQVLEFNATHSAAKDTEATDAALELLDEAEDWERNARAGAAAGRAAEARAFSAGIGIVYSQDGAVVEALSDGSVRVLVPAPAEPA